MSLRTLGEYDVAHLEGISMHELFRTTRNGNGGLDIGLRYRGGIVLSVIWV
jgi:hypothetical protein